VKICTHVTRAELRQGEQTTLFGYTLSCCEFVTNIITTITIGVITTIITVTITIITRSGSWRGIARAI
jgi:hypothetical protein